MRITIDSGKEPRVTLTAAEMRGLQTTLEVARGIAKHLEYGINPLKPEHGTAHHLLADGGLLTFVAKYAPAEAEEAIGETGQEDGAVKQGESDEG